MFSDLETEALKIDPASIVPCDLQLHMSGKHMEAPYDFYNGKLPNFLSLSRPAYETLLRKLVRKNCDNVEFVIGTVTGMDVDVDGPSQGLEGAGTGHRVQSVTIRSKDGVESTEPALLLIGKSSLRRIETSTQKARQTARVQFQLPSSGFPRRLNPSKCLGISMTRKCTTPVASTMSILLSWQTSRSHEAIQKFRLSTSSYLILL